MRGIGSNTYPNSSLHYQSQTTARNPGRLERDVEPPKDPEHVKRMSVAAKHAIEEMLSKLKQDKQSFLASQNPPIPSESLASKKSQRSMSHAESKDKQMGFTQRSRRTAIYVKPETGTYIGITKEEFEASIGHEKSHFLDAASRQQ